MLTALLVGHPTAVGILLAALAAVLPFFAALAGARYTEWSRPQRWLWEVYHRLDAEGRELVTEVARRGRATGRIGGTPVTVTIASEMIVTWREEGRWWRSSGERVTVVADAPASCAEPFAVRAEAPVDPEDDDWKVPARVCEALGAPLRAEREPPAAIVLRLRGDAGEALRRLVTFDRPSATGWHRLDLSCSDGKIRLDAVAFGDAEVADALRVVAALCGTPFPGPSEPSESDGPAEPSYPRIAGSYREPARAEERTPAKGVTPPLPPCPRPTPSERVWIALRTLSVESTLVMPFLFALFLSNVVVPFVPFALASARTVAGAGALLVLIALCGLKYGAARDDDSSPPRLTRIE